MAGKNIEQIFGDRFGSLILPEAADMSSLVLMNNHGEGFTSTAVPMQRQWAPVFCFYSDDFNPGGKIDIQAGQFLWSPSF